MRAEIKLFALYIDPDRMSAFPGALKDTGDADVAQRAVYASEKPSLVTLSQVTL